MVQHALRSARSGAGDPVRRPRPPWPLVAGFGLFLAGICYILASSLARRCTPTYAPGPVTATRLSPSPRAVDTITVDARDETVWRFVDLGRGVGAPTLLPADTAGWDIAVRRHRIMAEDAIADAGAMAFDALTRAPAVGYRVNDPDSVNAAIRHWYDYSIMTHLLRPKGHLYVVRRRGGRYAKLEVLSYYCPGVEAGCLTLRVAPLTGPNAPAR